VDHRAAGRSPVRPRTAHEGGAAAGRDTVRCAVVDGLLLSGGREPSLLGRPRSTGRSLDAGIDRREQRGTFFRAEARPEGEHAVVVPPRLELSPDGDRIAVDSVCPPPLAAHPFDLGGGRLQGELDQRLLRIRIRDAGERTDLRERQPALGECGRDERQVGE
jgi:hypothetical protein